MTRTPERFPSGAQYQVAFGDQLAVVAEVGATLREYLAGGRAILDGFAAEEMCSGGRGQLLMPWPNRVRAGSYQLDGRQLQLALTEPDRLNAIHGLVRWVPWRLLEQREDGVSLGFTLHPQPGYPFTLELSVGYRLAEDGLTATLKARNEGRGIAPFGAGQHPYLKPRGGTLDGALLRVPARSHLELDERMIPTGRRLSVDGTRFDFRHPRPIGDLVLDACFADLEAPLIELDDLRLWWDATFQLVQLFSGDSLAADRRRQGLAVEPMTCQPDALNSHAGLLELEPGEEWSGRWGVRLIS